MSSPDSGLVGKIEMKEEITKVANSFEFKSQELASSKPVFAVIKTKFAQISA